MSIRRLFRAGGGVFTPSPSPSPTPTPTPTPSFTLATPAGWDGTQTWAARPAELTESTTQRNKLGVLWPSRPNVAVNVYTGMTMEKSGGYLVQVAMHIGNPDGIASVTVWWEGTTQTYTPTNLGDGFALLGFTLKDNAAHGGWARLQILVTPNRGFDKLSTYDVWANDSGSVVRPIFYVDPAGVDTNARDGSSANPWRNPMWAADYVLNSNAGAAATGFRIVHKSAGEYYTSNTYAGSNYQNTAPVTFEIANGLTAGSDVVWKRNASSNTDINTMDFHVLLMELWGIYLNTERCSAVRSINDSFSGRFAFMLRDGTKMDETPYLINGYQAGYSSTEAKAHRFFNPNNTTTFKGAAIGSASAPVILNGTHLAGLRKYVNVQGKAGWVAFFPMGTTADSDFHVMNSDVTSFGNYYARQHSNVTGNITAVASQVIGGTTYYKVTTDLTDLPTGGLNAALGINSTTGASMLDTPGEYFARIFKNGINVGGGASYANQAPEFPQNRDGSRDYPYRGWQVMGFDGANKVVWLLSDPGAIVGGTINIVRVHGSDALFIQSNGDQTLGNPENMFLYNSKLEHPEAQWLIQNSTNRALTGTLAYDGANTITFSASQTLKRGDTVTVESGGHLNETCIVRIGGTGTSFTVHDKVDGSGNVTRPFSASFSGVTCSAGNSLYGLGMYNFYFWGKGSGQFGPTGIAGWTVGSSTLALTSLFGGTFDMVFDVDASSRPGNLINDCAILDSVITGFQTRSGNPLLNNLYARNSHWVDTPSLETADTPATGALDFTTNLPSGLSRKASVSGTDRLGHTRTAGVSVIGSETV